MRCRVRCVQNLRVQADVGKYLPYKISPQSEQMQVRAPPIYGKNLSALRNEDDEQQMVRLSQMNMISLPTYQALASTVILLNIMCSMSLSTVCQYCVSTTCYVMCKKFGMCWTSFLFGVRKNSGPHPINCHSLPDLPTCTKVGRPISHLAQPESCAANSYTASFTSLQL